MDAKELYVKTEDGDFKGTGLWFCGKCRLTIPPQGKTPEQVRESAEKCCIPLKCPKCGAELPRFRYDLCDDCLSKKYAEQECQTMDAAEEVITCEYGVFWNEKYYSSPEECEDDVRDSEDFVDDGIGVWIHPAKPVIYKEVFNLGDMLKNLDENLQLQEDYDVADALNGLDELDAAINIFNQANADNPLCYQEDMTKKIKLCTERETTDV